MNVDALLKQDTKKLIRAFIIPTIIAQIIFAISRTSEKVFLGTQLGDKAIAAVSVTFPLFTFIIAFSMLIRVGAGTQISLALGKKDINYAEKVLGNAITLLTIFSITIISFCLPFLDEILIRIGANEEILPMSSLYMKITLIGLVVNFYVFGIGYIIRSEGNPSKGMWLIVIGAIVNIILSFIFIKKLDLGILGAALAPVIGNSVSVILIIYHLFKDKKRNISLKISNLYLNKSIVLKITSVGISAFIMMAGTSIIGITANIILMSKGGVLYVGALGSMNFTLLFIQIIITGLCYGFQPLFGYSFGNENYKRLRVYLKKAIIIASLFCILAFVFILGFSKNLAGLFSKQNINFIDTSIPLMLLFFMSLPVLGFNMLGSYFFQSIGNVKKAVFLSLIDKGLILLGFYIIPNLIGIKGIFLSFSVSQFILFFILLFLLKKQNRLINNKIIA